MRANVPSEDLPPLIWASAFETGNTEVDREHRELLVDLSNLSRSLVEGREWGQVVTISGQLRDKCIAHFRDEQAVLERSRYTKLAAHKREHRHIERQLDDILESISAVAQPSRAEVEAVLYLRSMLIHHFFRFDIAYKAHLLHAGSDGLRSKPRTTTRKL